jgi:hypothetical protein
VISALVVRRVLGDRPAGRPEPDQVERLDRLQGVVVDATARLASLDAEIEALRAQDPSDLIAGLERRLSALEEIAQRY